MRQVKAGVSIEELAADIAHRGLIASLNVRPVLDERRQRDRHVQGTGRRPSLPGARLLVKQKKLAKDEPVPCIVSNAATIGRRSGPALPKTAQYTLRGEVAGYLPQR